MTEKKQNGGFSTIGGLYQPCGLGVDGKALWNHLVDSMPAGVIQSVDGPLLFGLCRWWEIFKRWDRQCTAADSSIAYKASCMAGLAYKQFVNTAKEFGLTPKARQAIKYDAEENGTDVFSMWMKERMGE